MSCCSWWMSVPAWGTASEEEDAVLSRHHFRSVDTSETVVVRYGEDSWPEAGTGQSSVGWWWGRGSQPTSVHLASNNSSQMFIECFWDGDVDWCRRRLQHVMLQPSVCMELCLTGLYYRSTLLCCQSMAADHTRQHTSQCSLTLSLTHLLLLLLADISLLLCCFWAVVVDMTASLT